MPRQNTAEIIELFPDRQQPRFDPGADSDLVPVGNQPFDEIVSMDDSPDSMFSTEGMDVHEFSDNVADLLTSSQRSFVADRLVEYFEVDMSARENWQGLIDRALILLGVEKVDMSQLPFPGAAAVQHPLIAEACTQFQANAIEEFFPPTGPVKGDLAGKATPESTAQVERAEGYMNYYLTAEDTDYYSDTDQMLFYLPIVGSVFRKVFFDPRDQRPKSRYVKSEDFVAPYGARDLKNTSRYCHRFTMTGQEIRRAQNRGEFLDLSLPRVEPMSGAETSETMTDKSDRMRRVHHEDDRVYEILEYHIDFTLPGGVDEFDDGRYEPPYIITIDKENREVLSIRRNWKQDDPAYEKRVWFTHYKFLPGLGFYGWGFLHVLGSLAEAVSGSIRALLDSALMATVQGGFRAKDGAKTAGSIAIEPGKWKDIDATSDELNKTFYTPTYRDPPAALANLITSLVQDGRRYATLTETLVGTANNKAPVGTTLALIEQSMKVFSAIHKRIFAASREEFRMLAELIYEFGPDQYPYFLEGEEIVALKEDFDDRVDFMPVADPNIVSSVQRIAMAQAQIELINSAPHLYGPEQTIEAHKRLLKALKVPMSEAVEPKLQTPGRLDPVGENAQMITGKSAKAFPGQLHRAHNALHQYALNLAKNTMPPEQFQLVFQNITAHMREHDALEMVEQISAKMQQTMGVPLPEIDYLGGFDEEMDPMLEQALTVAASQNMPQLLAPQPGSVGEEEAQGQQGPDPMAEAEAKNKAREAETIGKMETSAAETAARIKREEEVHKQRLRQREEEHQQKLDMMSESTAAEIIRKAAVARQQRTHTEQSHGVKLQGEARMSRLRERQAARAAKKKPAKEKA